MIWWKRKDVSARVHRAIRTCLPFEEIQTPMSFPSSHPVVRPLAGVLFLLASAAAWAQQTSVILNLSPTRVFGHTKLLQVTSAPNLVEGREVSNPNAVALDTSVTPPILYVSDSFNNRVLAFRNSTTITKANMADRVIGQRDFQSTTPQGPGTGLSTGLALPGAIAVDRTGNLYVIDTGNQRILRYPRPLQQTGDLLQVDLVIGQRTISTQATNPGNSLPTAKSLFVTSSASNVISSLAFDPQGNLWVTDTGNNRTLRFPVSQLAANTLEPTADLVIGQTDFVTRAQPVTPQGVQPVLFKGSNLNPSGIAFDSNGRLYIADVAGRVLYYTPPFNSGAFAQRILGIQVQVQGQPQLTFPNNTSLASNPSTSSGGSGTTPLQGLLVINNNLFVTDPAANRIVRYDTPETWTPESDTLPSPVMKSVIGQADFRSGQANRGVKEATPIAFAFPVAMAYSGSELWVADRNNNRVLSFPVTGDLAFVNSNRLIGQLDYPYSAPNLVEGRELWVLNGNSNNVPNGGSGVAIDRNSNPPRLYVADSLNNRILGFKDARQVRPGDKADLVIGQTDLFRTQLNSPAGDVDLPTDTGLFGPTGLAVDDRGNLWVADTGNGRLLRFPSPFTQPNLASQRATLVLGQSSFFGKITDAGIANMRAPYGLTLLLDGSVVSSDVSHNRVLVFRRPNGGDFTNGQQAAVVYGQANFSDTNPGPNNTSLNRFNRPTQIATDTDDRLYVCDNGTGRVMVFTRVPLSGTNLNSTVQITGFNGASGMTISPLTGELWVADTFSNRVLRFPQYDTLLLNPQQATFTIQASAPVAVGLDAFDNLVVVEGSNRLAMYFQALTFQNAANFVTRFMAPNMLAYLYRLGRPFQNWDTTKDATAKPWSPTVGDVQVLVNGSPAPVYQLIPGRVDFQVPQSAPTSDFAEFQVVVASTGQILGVGNLPMNIADPALFATSGGRGQLAATNQDNTINGPGNGAARGSIVTLYGTGQGPLVNGPPDGQAITGPAPTPVKPRVVFAGVILKDEDVSYSGGTSFPAGWQINIKVPDPQGAPGVANPVGLQLYDLNTNVGPTGPIQLTIFVK